MKPDSMLVEPDYIASAGQQVVGEGADNVLATLAETEPALASYIHQSLAAVAGKLALSGAPIPVVQGSHEEILTIVLVSLAALRRGHFELWKDSLAGTPLARLTDEAPVPTPPKPTRKKRRGSPGSDE
jgi:hypothetical protein